jgi:hypothetical protein
MVTLHSTAARLLAVEVLLAEPEALADDVLGVGIAATLAANVAHGLGMA